LRRSKGVTIGFLLVAGSLAASSANQACAQNPMRVTVGQNMLSIHAEQQPLLHYRLDNAASKPYARQLFSPAGLNVLRDAPADHLHHHGLMFAVKVDGVNFWEERRGCGRQVHRSLGNISIYQRHNLPAAAFTEQIDWTDSDPQKILLKEVRTIEVARSNDLSVTLLIWQSIFEAPPGKESVTLTGSHYHGLGMRFLESMDRTGKFQNPDGKAGEVFRGDERLLRSTWCAYTADANGRPVTVAMFDHPDNPRHPATWFTMAKPFAYLSATLSLHTEPLNVTSGKPLVLRYAVALWDAQVAPQQIDRLYRQWTAWPALPTGK